MTETSVNAVRDTIHNFGKTNEGGTYQSFHIYIVIKVNKNDDIFVQLYLLNTVNPLEIVSTKQQK